MTEHTHKTPRCIAEFLQVNFHLMPAVYTKQQSEKEIRGDLFSLKEDTDGMCKGSKDSGSFENVILSKGRQTEKDKYPIILLACGI